MNRTLGLVCATMLSLGVVSLACSSGEVVEGPLGGSTGTPGAAGSTGVAGSSTTGVAGSNRVAGSSPTGIAGSSSKGGSTGVAGSTSSKGGSTGVAGSTSSKGGSTGVAGSSPTGVAGSSPTGVAGSGNSSGATTCIMGLSTVPPTALITDFSDAVADPSNAGEFKFGGMAVSAQGGTSRFASGTKGTLDAASGALKFTATVEAPTTTTPYPYNGFSLYVNGPGCVNAASYVGISFKISGLTGTCPLEFGFSDSAHTTASADPNRGTGASGSYAAGYTVTAATTAINFTTTPASPGSPAALVDPAKLIGIQFQFKPVSSTATASCTGSFSVDDLKFTH